jgi:peptidyl-prolyl cis-trans isomerase C
MRKGLILILMLLAAGGISWSCKKKETEKAPGGFDLGGQFQPNAVLARVNGMEITRSEVDRETNNLLQQFQGRIPPGQANQLRANLEKQALENLINLRLLTQELEREGIEVEKEAVDERIDEIKNRMPSPEKFQEQLALSGISEEQFRRIIENNIKIETLLDRHAPPGEEASEEQIEIFYKNNPENFQVPEQVQASHILIKLEPGADEAAKAEARKKIEEIQQKLKEGEDFAALAKDNSACPSSARGGDLGYFGRGQMVPAFEEAAFSLQSGETSEIVETQFGYHLIRVTGREEARDIPLEEAREKISTFLNSQNRQQAISDYIGQLRKEARIEYSAGSQPPPPPQPQAQM